MDVVMPQLGETVKQGTVAAWRKKVGDRVEKDEPLFEVSTDKVETDIPAPASGVLAEILVPEGETVAVGARLAVIAVPGEVRSAPSAAAGAAPASPAAAGAPSPPARAARAAPASRRERDEGGARLSPVVRRLLEEHHLDPAAIAGSGADGRITRDDVLAHVARTKGEAAPAAGDDTVVPMNRIRKLTAERTARSAAVSPHVLQAVEVDFSAVEAARGARGAAWKASEGFSLTYLPFVARAVCEAIREFPNVNASVSGDSLVVHRRVNLGVAVDLGFEGLVVPVVKDAQKRTLRELARELHALAEKARRRALLPDDVAGGTYTLSNSGPFGTLLTAPIIQQPQVAILSTDGVKKRPVAVEGPDGDAVAVHPVGVLAQCFDHRAFDGAYSAAFLKRLREILEGRDWSGELT
jgi:pyruvate dehydrogenase E2 component (dihydrolipoyllysine-residue acetyltransferase)